MNRLIAALLTLVLAACGEDALTPRFHADENPTQLSDWGVLAVQDGALRLADASIAYDLATPLFSDYALKLRTVTLPDGETMQWRDDAVFDMPVGTIITKTFYYAHEGAWSGIVDIGSPRAPEDGLMNLKGLRLIETRLLVRRETGWVALPYVWNEGQTDAALKRTGDVKRLTLARSDLEAEEFAYIVPNANQCAGCHGVNNTTREIEPIGPKARHLNFASSLTGDENQLASWIDRGVLTGAPVADARPANAVWMDDAAPLDARARAYLDANCSHCHSDVGPADTSGLDLRPDVQLGPAVGFCKSPVAAGSGSGGRPYDIVPGAPNQSIFVFRMETTDPGAMMPELGRAVVHDEGVRLIAEWIAEMNGACA